MESRHNELSGSEGGALSRLTARPRRLAAFAAVGDAVVFLVFAAAGRSSHGESGAVVHVLGTALPFLLGWYVSAAIGGGYHITALTVRRSAAATVGRCWMAAVVPALLLRSVLERHLVPLSFVLVAFFFNLALLEAWRLILTYLPAATSAADSR